MNAQQTDELAAWLPPPLSPLLLWDQCGPTTAPSTISRSHSVTIRAWQKMPGNADAYQDALQRIAEIAAATEAPSSTRLTAPDEMTVGPRTRRCGDRLPSVAEPGPRSTLGTPSAPSEE